MHSSSVTLADMTCVGIVGGARSVSGWRELGDHGMFQAGVLKPRLEQGVTGASIHRDDEPSMMMADHTAGTESWRRGQGARRTLKMTSVFLSPAAHRLSAGSAAADHAVARCGRDERDHTTEGPRRPGGRRGADKRL